MINEADPVEITEGVWWVGFSDNEAGFSNNPYLIVDEGGGILSYFPFSIDPETYAVKFSLN